MISLEHKGRPLCDGISRREFLAAGALGPVGLSLPALLASQSAAAPGKGSFGRAKRVIQLYLWGGPGAQETWDLKPDAPSATRGDFKPISTTVPGTQICEHLPLLARRAHKYAIIRSCAHTGVNHGTSSYHMLTGQIHPDPGTLRRPSKNDTPQIAISASRFVEARAGVPRCVAIPNPIWDGGVTEVPGQRPGFLGERFEPFRVTGDLTRKDFRPEELRLVEGVDANRLGRRAGLLDSIERRGSHLREEAEPGALATYYEKALGMLSSQDTVRAFDLSSEPEKARERYGWHWWGQSVALARRLAEHGVPLITVYWNTPALTVDDSWDTHADQHRRMKDHILPPFDRSLAALLDDLDERGLLEDTLVTWYGEFGRTPKINKGGGRDHWGFCQSIGLAGAGVVGGALLGSSTEDGGYPASDPVTPDDVAATIFYSLGINPHALQYDLQARPLPIAGGEPIRQILR